MAELPEVHTIAGDLKKHIVGWLIDKVVILNGYNTLPDNRTFTELLTGTTVKKVGRIGKNIVMVLDTKNALVFHLGMTGRLLLRKVEEKADDFQKLEITLSKDSKTYSLRYCDMRMFGKASALTPEELRNLRGKYGPDLVADSITPEEFLKRLTIKRTTIKNALLEQSLVAGLGNIYATDALWIAKVHPETRTDKLSPDQARALLKAAKGVLEEGITHRGSTLPDKAYLDILGRPGRHQNHFRIYGKSVCPECRTKLLLKKINGRGSYFCPICQI